MANLTHQFDGLLVQEVRSFVLRLALLNEEGIHRFKVDQDEQLLDRSVITHVALEFWMLSAPLLGGHSEQRYIQNIGFVSIDKALLFFRQFRWNEVCFDSISMNTVIRFGKNAIYTPVQRKTVVFIIFQTLVIFDDIEFEFWRNP